MKKKYIIIISSIIFVISLGIILSYFLMLKNTKGYLVSGNKVDVEVFSMYKDDGVILKRGKKVIPKKRYKVKTKGSVNTNKIGNYKLKYDIKYHTKNIKLVRNVTVVDTTNPVMETNYDEVHMDYCTKKIKEDIKYTATDNYDGDITNDVLVETKDDVISYSITDSSGNLGYKEIKIIYNKKPQNKFSLNGKEKVSVVLNNSYEEKGAKYEDGCGNKIEKEIKISGEVNTNVEGEYTITYEIEGEKPITRKVYVYEKKYSPKTIYLTFDDGPGSNTPRILDTLAKHNVKATFFVTNQFPSYQYLIAREHNEGHKVAAHTYSHRYGDVYTSFEAYLDDFNKINEIIKNQTGSYTNIFRFPGGSSNTVSRKYKEGVVTEIATEMTNRGYYYFDWNISSGDASGANTNGVYNNVINGVERCSSSCVVLMHDIKGTTASALDDILTELEKRGYSFDVISESTPTTHSKIAN